MPTKCYLHNCTKAAVSKGLCDTHRKRVERHGSTEPTRPLDWGSKEKHPSYAAWCNLRRYHRDAIPAGWAASFWEFVKDTPPKPQGRVSVQRHDPARPWDASNFYWKEPISSVEARADRAAYAREFARKTRAENPGYHKNLFLKRRYGMSLTQYESMLAAQNGACAICQKTEVNEIKGKNISLAVDHCHATNRVRGLLCSSCNRALGLFDDSPDLLSKARKYLLHYLNIPGENPACQTDPADGAQTDRQLVHKGI
jgi:hypothetical protein